jgi:adenine/guanine phosphoribosyltransferase-like PRPP-binding protein
MTNDQLIGARDPLGIRPLVMGKLDEAIIFRVRNLRAGHDRRGVRPRSRARRGGHRVRRRDHVQSASARNVPARTCAFEYIYFARPDSIIDGISVYEARKRMGQRLAQETPADIDVVVPVPDSGMAAALGYAEEIGKPFDLGIIRSHFVGRTFIQPTQAKRDLGVRRKHAANPAALRGKKVLLVDDSVVRGTTSKKIVKMVREAGAKEVHFRSACPPITHPDFYGIDMPMREELMAASHEPEKMASMLGTDSLGFLSVDGLYWAVRNEAAQSRQSATRRPLFHRRLSHPACRPRSCAVEQGSTALTSGRRMTETSPMAGRVALVTGASRGLGYAICKQLAAEGAHVIAVARTQGGLEDLDDEIRQMGGACTIVPMDLQTPDGIEKLSEIVADRWGKLDALVVNAGVWA